ncbi:hypothetical protein EMGBS8_15870 [Verrucomicrobiota bacterium]|nr:hypothetical protein EMGBS8_15870 [Verrucomicrobiota bacterium]
MRIDGQSPAHRSECAGVRYLPTLALALVRAVRRGAPRRAGNGMRRCASRPKRKGRTGPSNSPSPARLSCSRTVVITGRTDQWREAGPRFISVKSRPSSISLPRRPEFLHVRYPHHFLQLGVYCHAARPPPWRRPDHRGTCLVDPDRWLKQTMALPDTAEADLLQQAETLAAHAENRRCQSRPAYSIYPTVFPSRSPAQNGSSPCADLDQATMESPIRLMVAPTGFRKNPPPLYATGLPSSAADGRAASSTSRAK